MSNKDVLSAFVGGPNVKIKRTVLPAYRDAQGHDTIGYELLVNKTWAQHDYIVQIAEELGFEFMDEETYNDNVYEDTHNGIVYDYYFKFI